MFLTSTPDTVVACLSLRFRLRLLLDKMWLLKPLRRTILPLLLILNLLAAPRLVFIFGMLDSSLSLD